MKQLFQLTVLLWGIGSIPASYAEELSLSSCYMDGIERQVMCGTLDVPENYQQPDGKKITLNITVLPAIDNTQNLTPMMFLAGGPGQPATSIAALVKTAHKDVLKRRDIILVDQRGTGKSEGLECEALDDENIYSMIATQSDVEGIVKQCVAQFTQDLSQYNTENAIRDFDQVRQALGHERINLYGGSYGTRAALIYMKLFPETLDTVVIDSVSPVEKPIGLFGQSAARAFSLMLKDCAVDPSCSTTFPNLESEFSELMMRLDTAPVELTISHPRTAEPTLLKLDSEKLVSMLRFQLYGTDSRSMMPFVIHQAYNQNYLPLVGLIARSEFGLGINSALLMNIVCNEDIPRVSPEEFASDANNTFGRDASHLSFTRICEHWPIYKVFDGFSEPVNANIPTLILSGELDPVTPPSNGNFPAMSLPNNQHLIAPNVGHIVAGKGCSSTLIAEFLDTQDPNAIDGSCLNDIPSVPFVTSVNGSL